MVVVVWVGVATLGSHGCSSDLCLRVDSLAHRWSSQAFVGSLADCWVEALVRRYQGTGMMAGMIVWTAEGTRYQVSDQTAAEMRMWTAAALTDTAVGTREWAEWRERTAAGTREWAEWREQVVVG